MSRLVDLERSAHLPADGRASPVRAYNQFGAHLPASALTVKPPHSRPRPGGDIDLPHAHADDRTGRGGRGRQDPTGGRVGDVH